MVHKTIIINGIAIDRKISNIIKKLWDAKVQTYMCCQGGRSNIDEYDDSNKQFYYNYKAKRRYECSWIIINIKDYKIAKKILGSNIITIKGSNGYMINDIEDIDDKYLVFICWKNEEAK